MNFMFLTIYNTPHNFNTFSSITMFSCIILLCIYLFISILIERIIFFSNFITCWINNFIFTVLMFFYSFMFLYRIFVIIILLCD